MVKFNFKGLLCPVFTPFTMDKKHIDYNVIDKYGNFLKTKGVNGILVNSPIGEGMTLTTDERKKLAEEWLKVCRKYGMTMVLTIGGIDVTDVYDLSIHAEKIGVDAIVLLPDLFYKPKVEEDLVDYFKDVSKYVTNIPLLYFHYPKMTHVNLNLLRVHELIQRTVTNWGGFYFKHHNLELAKELLKEGIYTIVYTDIVLTSVMILGFDTIATIVSNLFADNVKEIYDLCLNYKFKEAFDLNEKLFHYYKGIYTTYTLDKIEVMKTEFNKKFDFKVGGIRKPKITYIWKKF